MSQIVEKILKNYKSEPPSVQLQLYRLLNHGALQGSGRLLIYPVDQGFEHGPFMSYLTNEAAFDPHYHFRLAVEGRTSAYAAPLGALSVGVCDFLGQVPLILKMNSCNRLYEGHNAPDQALTGSVNEALRLGCIGVGLTIYPGSDSSLKMFEEVKETIQEARSKGLLTIVWSYPRGGGMSQDGEISLDIVAYGAHMACLLGAHIVKVKLPSSTLYSKAERYLFEERGLKIEALEDRIRFIVKACFEGRRLVVFSGGEATTIDSVLESAKAIHKGGGSGSIVGRNCFKRPYEEGLNLLHSLARSYLSS